MARELAVCLQKARAEGRGDLVARLESARSAVTERDLPVVVVGEFKQGKSSLVNALVKSTVCPVDDDIVTAVPTVVRYGETPEALVHRANLFADTPGTRHPNLLADDQPPPRRITLEQVAAYVRGEVVDDDCLESVCRIRSVEVRLNRRILGSALSFVDCPGLGGLESAEGSVALGMLTLAEAVLFVTDASQELTRAELTFIQAALGRCPRVVCVVSKIDLHPEWRRIVELNRGHLAAAGLDVPVLPVSSFLRMRAATTDDPTLNDESQFPTLTGWLQDEVVRRGGRGRVERAAAEVLLAANLLRSSLQAESQVIADPAAAPQVVAQLSHAATVTEALRTSGAPWQRVLSDGIQDLVEDVRHDLRDRLRTVLQSGEQVIDRSDPKDSWAEFETWVRRQVVSAAVGTYDHMVRQAAALTEEVGRQFSHDAASSLALSIPAPVAALERIRLSGDFMAQAGSIKSNVLLSAARGSYGGMVMFGMAGSLIGFSVTAPVALLLSLGLGRKSVRDELNRRHQQRQAQAKAALRQYVDKVSFVVDKECRDALRRTQRLLRDEFLTQAQVLQRSSMDAMAHAQQSAALTPEERAARLAAVDRELHTLGELGDRAAATMSGGVQTSSTRPAEHTAVAGEAGTCP